MDGTELRRHCAEVVARIRIPSPFDINALVDAVECRREREISLVAMPLPVQPGSPCGLWVATDQVDYVLYHRDTSKAHQEHIVMHELGHMLLGHGSTDADQDEASKLLMPNLKPEFVRAVLARSVYTSEEERAAELVASLLPLQVRRRGGPAPERSVSPGAANLVQHLGAALERNSRRT
ncbi:ImmA/IrrE family metallo-endopeptidase [Kitasatospora sp. NPDC008050]|uniref:ImmA/IrrE family metallo-endopeptidase n=1 Tax=Kitasatospora sp. NPDC008050 TaxID=3364021 RepID=UPI0036ED64CA